MHCAFSRDCEARRPHHDSKFSLCPPDALSARITTLLFPAILLSLSFSHALSHSLSRSLALSICHHGFLRPLAFSTNGHNYVHVPIHNPHCQPRLPAALSSTKCTTTSRPFTLDVLVRYRAPRSSRDFHCRRSSPLLLVFPDPRGPFVSFLLLFSLWLSSLSRRPSILRRQRRRR